jgi:EpsI family protein
VSDKESPEFTAHNEPLTKKDWYMKSISDRFFDNKGMFILSGLFGLAIILLYRSTFVWLIGIWWNDKESSHGFLIPFVALYLVWIKRDHLKRLEVRPRPFAGGLVLLSAGVLLLAGRAGAFVLAEGISFLVMLPGVVLFVWGWNHLRALALPLAYLQFMVPWMDEFINRIHVPFQLLSANMGVWIMKALGMSVFHEGRFIHLPGISLEVARACSGVSFLTSVIALGVPLVYLTQRTYWRAAGVITFSVIITILTNGIRVAVAGFLAYKYGLEMLHGPSHVFQGWFVAQVGIVALFLTNWAVGKIPSGKETSLCDRWKVSGTGEPDYRNRTPILQHAVLALIFLGGLGVYVQFFAVPKPVPVKRTFADFPNSIAGWEGIRSDWLSGERYFPGVDEEVVRVYRKPDGREIHLYIGYFESQRQGKSLINFRANPLRERVETVPTGFGPSGPVMVNRSFPEIDRMHYTALSWYRFPTGETTGRYKTKLKAITDAMLYRRNNGAIILVAAPILSDADLKSVSVEVLAFTRDIAPLLREYLP